MNILFQKYPLDAIVIRLFPTHVGVGLLLRYNLTSSVLPFEMYLRPTLWVSVVINSFYAFTKHVYCPLARVGLKSTPRHTPTFIILRAKRRPTPTLINALFACAVVYEN
jgi:hypothetical protein